MFTALVRLTTRWPRLVLALTALFVAAAAVVGQGVSARLSAGGTDDPGSQSSRAGAVLDHAFPGSRPNLFLLVHTPSGVDGLAAADEGAALTAEVARDPAVTAVASYWRSHSAALRSHDARSALITVQIAGDTAAANRAVDRIRGDLRRGTGGLAVDIGGPLEVQREIQQTVNQDLATAELIALPLTLIALLLVFGSAVSALLPVAIGITAVLGTGAVLRILTAFTDVSVFAENLATALGLGLAIDYALLIVRRFREELATTGDPVEAARRTLHTAGRTVLFSAVTVALALSAMLLFRPFFLRSFAYAGISVVLLAAAAALVLLPAALVLLGPRVELGRIPRLGDPREPDATRLAAVVRFATRRAPVVALAVTALLVSLGLPFLGARFGTVDYRQLPPEAQARQTQDVVNAAFPTGSVGASTVLLQGALTPQAEAGYAARLSALPGVRMVESPQGAFEDGVAVTVPADPTAAHATLSYLTVFPTADPLSPSGLDLVRALRAEPAPAPASVTGDAAALLDTQHAIGGRLAAAAAVILLATWLLVLLLTGSLLIPLVTVVLSTLGLGATFGATVWIFQDGHLAGLIGFTPVGTVPTSTPVLMFCVAFGLSMDYSVFVLARIKEEFDRTGDHRAAIRNGLARTGGTVTAAALVLSIVLVAIGSSRIVNTQMLGLGLTLAVLMDATLVRCLLLPALLRLLGRAAWWAPSPLHRLLARVGLSESEPGPPAPETAAAPDASPDLLSPGRNDP